MRNYKNLERIKNSLFFANFDLSNILGKDSPGSGPNGYENSCMSYTDIDGSIVYEADFENGYIGKYYTELPKSTQY